MKLPTQFSHGGHEYQIKRIDALTQLVLAQKVAPIVIPIIRAGLQSEAAKEALNKSADVSSLDLLTAMLPNFETIAVAWRDMPSEDTKFIVNTCLSYLVRKGGAGLSWQEVYDHQAGIIYDDIQGFDMLMLSVQVIKDQLGNFISGVLSMFPGSGLPEQTTSL